MYTCIKHTVKFKFVNYLKLKYYIIHVGNVLKQLLSHFNSSILNYYIVSLLKLIFTIVVNALLLPFYKLLNVSDKKNKNNILLNNSNLFS